MDSSITPSVVDTSIIDRNSLHSISEISRDNSSIVKSLPNLNQNSVAIISLERE